MKKRWYLTITYQTMKLKYEVIEFAQEYIYFEVQIMKKRKKNK